MRGIVSTVVDEVLVLTGVFSVPHSLELGHGHIRACNRVGA